MLLRGLSCADEYSVMGAVVQFAVGKSLESLVGARLGEGALL